jgi:hypothetical protein
MVVLVNCKHHQIADNMVSDDPPIFVDERELHKRLALHLCRDRFRVVKRTDDGPYVSTKA